jgi:hypothetical protein
MASRYPLCHSFTGDLNEVAAQFGMVWIPIFRHRDGALRDWSVAFLASPVMVGSSLALLLGLYQSKLRHIS